MKTKKQILRQCMSAPYCGETRFDFLDPEEIVMIEMAMKVYANQRIKYVKKAKL